MADTKVEPTEVKPPVAAFVPQDMNRGDNAPVMYRNTTVEPDDFSSDNTFQIAISSEYPGLQRASAEHEKLGIAKEGELFTEILSHEPADVDLSWLNSGRAAFLDEHKNNRHLGKIHKANLSQDKVVRGVVECDEQTKLSKTRRNQIRKKSRVNISCGYVHTRYLGATTMPDGKLAHRFAFQPREASSVADPLDPTVGLNRAAEKCACFGCGKIVGRSEMKSSDDGALYCSQDCIDAEDADESLRSIEDAKKNFRASKPNDFKFRLKRDKEDEISFSDLSGMVGKAADSDKRFKSKRPNGDLVSCSYVQDIICDPDEGAWCAVIYNYYDNTYWRVEFDINGSEVALGDAQEVQMVSEFQPVENRSNRSQEVDSSKLAEAEKTAQENLPIKVMPKNIAELEAENPTLVTELRTAERTSTRKAVLDEVHQAVEKRSGKVTEQLKEIRSLADAHCKDSGKNWAGPDNAVVVVADEIRKLERSAHDEIGALKDDETFYSNATTIRNKFKTDAGELVRNSYSPREQVEAGTVDADLAEKVSLKRLWGEANKAFERGDRRKCFLLSDGAEFEADKELRNIAGRYPGGLGYSPEGQLFPQNTRGHLRPELKRTLREVDARRAGGENMTRVGLLSDYPSLSALVAPEYMTPIELLRNKLVLVGKGLMEVHGVVGNPLTFPRLSAPTQAQSLAEGVAAALYDQVFDQVKLVPHRVTTAQKYSRLGMSQAPGFEGIVWDDHARQAALYMNRGLVNGVGGGDDVLGILNAVGIGAVGFAGSAANAWKNIFGPGGLVTLIRKANIPDDITLLSTSVGAGTLRTTAAVVAGATAYGVGTNAGILVGDQIGGKDFEESQQIPADILLAVAARHIIWATWAGLNVVLDTTQFADQDLFRIVTNQYYDVGLRHSQAVARSTDSIAALS